MFKHAVRNRIGYLFDQLQGNCIFERVGSCVFCIFFQLLANVSLQFVNSIEIRSVLYELIVQFRQFFVRNAVDRAVEYSFLACIFVHLVIFRESYGNIEVFADVVTCNLFLKARNELTAAQLQLIVFALAAVECFVAEEALKVQVYFVTHFRCTVIYRYHACISLTHGFNLLIYVFVSDFLDNLRSLDALIAFQRDLRLGNADDLHGNAVFLADSSYFYLRGIYHIQLVVHDQSRQFHIQQSVDRIFIEYVFAISSLAHFPRYLALTEARHRDILLLTLISSFYCLFKAFCIDFNDQFGHVYICLV